MTEAGWYRDPSGKHDVCRWWDGRAWSRWLSRDHQAPAPPPEQTSPEQTSTEQTSTEQTPAEQTPAEQRPPNHRPALAVGIGILVLIVGIGALIGVAVLQGRETVTGPPVAPPPPLSSQSGANRPTYDEDTREADVGGLAATMPGPPFVVDTLSEEFVGVAKPVRQAQALVHANFDGEKDWYASCAIGIVDPSLVVEGDIEKTGRNLWKAVGENWYVGYPFQEKDVKEEHPPNQDVDVFAIQGDLHYKIKGLASTYDRMSLIVVDLGDGRFGTWFGSRPDDAKKGLIEQYQHSLDSLKKTR